MKKSLISLMLGGLSLGMTEFMMMGVLPDVASSLGITIPAAGYLISAYALGVVIGAPLMAMLSRRHTPKNTLIGLMVLFAVFNFLFSVSPNFESLLLTRLLAGLPHGAFFGVGAVLAGRLAVDGKKGQAISIMFAGLTLANVVGVPLGTLIGHHITWRLSFMLVAVIALITAMAIRRWMPDLKVEAQRSLASALDVFRSADCWLIMGISTIGTAGMFAWISYIAPFMTGVANFSSNSVTMIMVIAGVGMAFGNLIGGRLADKFSPLGATAGLLLGMVMSLLAVASVSAYQIPALVLTFTTGAMAFAIISPMQVLMINAARGSEMLASSVVQATANMANALGAFLGGLPIAAGYDYTATMYVGAGLAAAGLLISLVIAVKKAYENKNFDIEIVRIYNSLKGS